MTARKSAAIAADAAGHCREGRSTARGRTSARTF